MGASRVGGTSTPFLIQHELVKFLSMDHVLEERMLRRSWRAAGCLSGHALGFHPRQGEVEGKEDLSRSGSPATVQSQPLLEALELNQPTQVPLLWQRWLYLCTFVSCGTALCGEGHMSEAVHKQAEGQSALPTAPQQLLGRVVWTPHLLPTQISSAPFLSCKMEIVFLPLRPCGVGRKTLDKAPGTVAIMDWMLSPQNSHVER